MTDYTIISKYRNKAQCEWLVKKLEERGKTCYNFCATPADPTNPTAHPDEQMQKTENQKEFLNDAYTKAVFAKDLDGLKAAKRVIVLMPAGASTHIEAGIAYGLGKPLILIGEPEKQESLYFIFSQRYRTADEFLASV